MAPVGRGCRLVGPISLERSTKALRSLVLVSQNFFEEGIVQKRDREKRESEVRFCNTQTKCEQETERSWVSTLERVNVHIPHE